MLEFNFYNVGHGSCSHIITPNRKHILVDIGSSDDFSVPSYIKHELKADQIDCLIITHPHIDHISGIVDLDILKQVKFAINNAGKPGGDTGFFNKVWGGVKKSGQFAWTNYNDKLRLRTLLINKSAYPLGTWGFLQKDRCIANKANEMNDNYKWSVPWEFSLYNPEYNGGVEINIHLPPDCYSKDDLNKFSCVYTFEYANKKVVITGDNNKEILEKMIHDNNNNREFLENIKDADILLAPHHGRDSDFCKEFFAEVNPCLTVISDKPKEHDTQKKAANNYRGRGLPVNGEERYVLTTRKDGSIRVRIFENGELKIETHTTGS